MKRLFCIIILILALSMGTMMPLTQVAAEDLGTYSWTGEWETSWGDMTLNQNGTKVTGTYTFDSGKIEGTVSGNVLTGTWSESPSYAPPRDAGEVEFVMSTDGKSFTGKWRYGSEGNWGNWEGGNRNTEVILASPAPKAPTPAPTPSQNTRPVSAASGIPKDDNGIAGLWLGTYWVYGTNGIEWRWMTFFEDGTFYFDLPREGFIGFDKSESKNALADFWGTYTFSGSSGIWKYNAETGNGSEMAIAEDGGLDTGGYGRFYRCVSVNGLKLNGAYTTYDDPTDPDLKKEGTKPVIRFKTDGTFVDEGLYLVTDPLSEDEAQRAPGSGTYEIKDFSLILHYSDGRTKQAGFTLGYKGSVEESPYYICIYRKTMKRIP